MVRVKANAARNGLLDLLSQVQFRSDRIVIERRGKDAAALISMKDLRLLELLEDTIDVEAARQALESPKNKARVPLREVKKRTEVLTRRRVMD